MSSAFGGEGEFDLKARLVWHSFRSNARSHTLLLWVSRYIRTGRQHFHVCRILRCGEMQNDLRAIAENETNKRWGSEMELTVVNIKT